MCVHACVHARMQLGALSCPAELGGGLTRTAHLVEQDEVGEGQLLHGFVDCAHRLEILQMLRRRGG